MVEWMLCLWEAIKLIILWACFECVCVCVCVRFSYSTTSPVTLKLIARGCVLLERERARHRESKWLCEWEREIVLVTTTTACEHFCILYIWECVDMCKCVCVFCVYKNVVFSDLFSVDCGHDYYLSRLYLSSSSALSWLKQNCCWPSLNLGFCW